MAHKNTATNQKHHCERIHGKLEPGFQSQFNWQTYSEVFIMNLYELGRFSFPLDLQFRMIIIVEEMPIHGGVNKTKTTDELFGQLSECHASPLVLEEKNGCAWRQNSVVTHLSYSFKCLDHYSWCIVGGIKIIDCNYNNISIEFSIDSNHATEYT